MKAKIEGREYNIPEMWLAGFCSHGASIREAVLHWHEQALAAEKYEAERAAVGEGTFEVKREAMKPQERAMKSDFVEPPYQMASGRGVAAEHTYERIDGKRAVWLVAMDVENRGDYVYSHRPEDKNSDGFGGARLSFTLTDGSEYTAKGPWHSNADSCYEDTGRDFRAMYKTYVVLGTGRESNDPPRDYRTRITGVVYRDPDGGVVGRFDRHKDVAEKYSEALYYYMASEGGSSCGTIGERWKAVKP